MGTAEIRESRKLSKLQRERWCNSLAQVVDVTATINRSEDVKKLPGFN